MRLFALLLAVAASPGWATGLLDVDVRPLADRETVNLQERFSGEVLLVVNTASRCGLAPQFEGLEALHSRYRDRGFSVIGFPSGDFRGQELDSEDAILEFCTLTYGVQFPMFEKTRVIGDDASPLYRELAARSGEAPAWNFHKYLVGRDGSLLGSFGSRVAPDDPGLVAAIEDALRAPVR